MKCSWCGQKNHDREYCPFEPLDQLRPRMDAAMSLYAFGQNCMRYGTEDIKKHPRFAELFYAATGRRV